MTKKLSEMKLLELEYHLALWKKKRKDFPEGSNFYQICSKRIVEYKREIRKRKIKVYGHDF